MTTSAYPLSWPQGWPRTDKARRTRAKFGKTERVHSEFSPNSSWTRKSELTINQASTRVMQQLRQFGVREGDAIVSTNVPVRLDGLPRGDAKVPTDPGVAVYWQRPGEAMKVMATDRYDRVADNLAAIAATLDAMRSIERHGGAQILERAFTGFAALPSPDAARPWWEVFDVDPGSITTRTDLDEKYKRLRSERHPDKGGSEAAFVELNEAYECAKNIIHT